MAHSDENRPNEPIDQIGQTAHPGTANLVPIRSTEMAREYARRSAETRRRRREERLAKIRADASEVAGALASLVALAERGPTIGDAAQAVALDVIGRIGRGEVPIRNGSEAADVVRVLVDIARLDAGQATSATAILHVRADRSDAVDQLRSRALAALSAAADVTADDPASLDVEGVEVLPAHTLPDDGGGMGDV